MDVFSRENAIIAACVVLAIAAYYLLAGFTNFSFELRLAVVFVLGVLLPGWLTSRFAA